MVYEVVIDGNKIAYCTFLKDGRIIKYFLKKEEMMIYVCEECDSTWFSMEGVFCEEGRLLIPYIQSLGYTERMNPNSWARIAENRGFLTVDDLDDVISVYNIEKIYI